METKDIKIGDFITAYHKGIHQVIRFYDYDYELCGGGPQKVKQVEYKKVVNSKMKLEKGKRIQSCAFAYCKKVTEESLQNELNKITNDYINVISYLKDKTL